MKRVINSLIVLLLAGCSVEARSPVLSYDELVNYPSRCDRADEQLKELRKIQSIKNFDQDPDNLNDQDRAYNSRLKATIWWYAYRCGKS